MFVLVVRNNFNPKAMESSYTLSAYLESQSINCCFVESSELYSGLTISDKGLEGADIDLAVVLGGDGTILRCARFLRGRSTPILGINFGNLGFLANSSEDGVLELVSRAFAGELIEDRRANLDITVECEPVDTDEGEADDASDSGDSTSIDCFALNEIAITRGSAGRVIQYALDISDVHIADVIGDGVIVSTATGSTGYSLAAGGPIVHPGFGGFIVQPIAPHTLTARAVVTQGSDVVCIDLTETPDNREPTLFTDGDALQLPSAVKRVLVKRGECPTTLLYAGRDHFYKYSASTFFKS